MIDLTMYDTLNYGTTKPTSVKDVTLKVNISITRIIEDYAQGFLDECARVNPLLFDKVCGELTKEKVIDYISYLLDKRIESVNNNCLEWRKLKVLVMPTFIQYVLSRIGKVVIYDEGLIIIPTKNEKSSITKVEDAFKISNLIRAFKDDLQIVEDAMPRGIYGDPDVMRCVVNAGDVYSMVEVTHPVSTYVAAFLNFTLRDLTSVQEISLEPDETPLDQMDYLILYRRRYDSVSFITEAMSAERTIFK